MVISNKKNKKTLSRILSIALAFIMVTAMAPLALMAEGISLITVDEASSARNRTQVNSNELSPIAVITNLADFEEALERIQSLDEIRLVDGLHLVFSGQITIPNDVDLIIGGASVNGSSITFTHQTQQGFINVEDGATLTLNNISLRINSPVTQYGPPASPINPDVSPRPRIGVRVFEGGTVHVTGTVETRLFTTFLTAPTVWNLPSAAGILVDGGTLQIGGVFNGSLAIGGGGVVNTMAGSDMGVPAGTAANGNISLITIVDGVFNHGAGANMANVTGNNENARIIVLPNGELNISGNAVRSIRNFGTLNIAEGGRLGPYPVAALTPENILAENSTNNIHGQITRRVDIFSDTTLPVSGHLAASVQVRYPATLTIYGQTGSTTVFHGATAVLQPGGLVAGAASGLNVDTQDAPFMTGTFIMNGGTVRVGPNGQGTVHLSGSGSRMYMHGGEVIGPSAILTSPAAGNAIGVGTGGFFRMTGGVIRDAANRGIFNNAANSTIEITGGIIENNGRAGLPVMPHFAGGGGILVANPSSTLNMTGGTIRGNTAPHGGGLYAAGDMSNITIGADVIFENNTATEGLNVSTYMPTRLPQIQGASFTYGAHPFNNHDINTNNCTGPEDPIGPITADFTCPYFLASIRAAIGVPYGDIYPHHVENITAINVPVQAQITSLAGIQHFTNLEVLDVRRSVVRTTYLTYLDVSQNSALRQLLLNNNEIATLDLTNNTALEILEYQQSGFEDTLIGSTSAGLVGTLDLRNNPALTSVVLRNNNLDEVLLGNHPNLNFIDLQNNNITGIDISNTAAYWGMPTNATPRLFLRHNLMTSFDDIVGWPRPGLPAYGNNYQRTQFEQRTPIITTIPRELSLSGVGIPFSFNIQAAATDLTYGASSVQWRVVGDLPNGLTLTSSGISGPTGVLQRSNALISGSLENEGPFSFTVEAYTNLGVSRATFTGDTHNVVYVNNTASLQAAVANIASLDEIRFTPGVVIDFDQTITIPAGRNILFSGAQTGTGVNINRSAINFTGNVENGAIVLGANSTLTLRDVSYRIPQPRVGDNASTGVVVPAGATFNSEGMNEMGLFGLRHDANPSLPLMENFAVLVDGGTFNVDGIFNGSLRMNSGTVNVNQGATMGSRGQVTEGIIPIMSLYGGVMNVAQGATVAAPGTTGTVGPQYLSNRVFISENAVVNNYGVFNRSFNLYGTFNLRSTGTLGAAQAANDNWANQIRPGSTFVTEATVGRVTQLFGQFEVSHGSTFSTRILVEDGGDLTIYGNIQALHVMGGGRATLQDGGRVAFQTNSVVLDNQNNPTQPATFVMNGGLVYTSLGGNSVSIRNGSAEAGNRFYMNGGTLNGGRLNIANIANSNGVYIGSYGFFRMTDGTIMYAANRGIFVDGNDATVEITGGTIRNNGRVGAPVVSGRFYGGGGVLVAGEGSTFNMTGGTIRDNTAPHGGGLYAVYMQNITIGPAVSFENNTATEGLIVSPQLAAANPQIQTTSVTHGTHPFNNHDINTNRAIGPFTLNVDFGADTTPNRVHEHGFGWYGRVGSNEWVTVGEDTIPPGMVVSGVNHIRGGAADTSALNWSWATGWRPTMLVNPLTQPPTQTPITQNNWEGLINNLPNIAVILFIDDAGGMRQVQYTSVARFTIDITGNGTVDNAENGQEFFSPAATAPFVARAEENSTLDRVYVNGDATVATIVSLPGNAYAVDISFTSNHYEVEFVFVSEGDADITADFTDPIFANVVREAAGLGSDAPITAADVASITTIAHNPGVGVADFGNRITSLAGIEHLTALTVLQIIHHAIVDPVDLSNNPLLVNVTINGGTSIVSGVRYHFLPGINLTGNPLLETLNILENRVTELDLRNNPLLRTLAAGESIALSTVLFPEAGMNYLTTVQMNSPSMAGRFGGLTSFTLNSAPLLTTLNINNSPDLASVTATNAPLLATVSLMNHGMTHSNQLNLAGNTSLFSLTVSGGNFEVFDATTLSPTIDFINLFNNNLTEIDLTNLVNLREINLNSNNLTTIDLSNNVSLQMLLLRDNQLAGHVDLSGLPVLRIVWMDNNFITSMDITGTAIGTPPFHGLFTQFAIDVTNNSMTNPDDVAGWRGQDPSLTVGGNFQFWPQRGVAPTQPVITTTTLPDGIVGQPFEFFFEADATSNIAWTVHRWDELNPGRELALVLAAGPSGRLFGTPLAGQEGTFEFYVRATTVGVSPALSHEQRFTITIRPEGWQPLSHVVNFDTITNDGQIFARVDGVYIHSGDRVPRGSTVEFYAVPNEGFRVQDWSLGFLASNTSDADSNQNVLPTFTIRNIRFDHEVFVSFSQDIVTHVVNFEAVGNGTLTATVNGQPIVSGQRVVSGSTVVFTATPAVGYTVSWGFEALGEGGSATPHVLEIENLRAGILVIATFVPVAQQAPTPMPEIPHITAPNRPINTVPQRPTPNPTPAPELAPQPNPEPELIQVGPGSTRR